MSKDELIAKQQLEIEQYKIAMAENKKTAKDLHMKFFAIGQPLNDNVLQFNKEQIKWAFSVYDLIENINTDIIN